MTTDEILRNGFYAMAATADSIVPGSGKHYRAVADREYAPHVHQWRKVPNAERTDSCRFACALYRCECGEKRYA